MQPPDAPTAGHASPQPGAPADFAAFDTPRMEALAQIAGGIDPALSDLLTVIRGQAGLLLDGAEPDAATQEPLKQIYAAAERASSLLRQLLIFSQQQTAHAEIITLNGLIAETAGVLRRLVGGEISVEFSLARTGRLSRRIQTCWSSSSSFLRSMPATRCPPAAGCCSKPKW